ncbi:3-hydroxy-3-methylglutaryl-coenzyme A reductase 1-like [Antedon mediterranea]|uniref:3-hydroxy-3-methylglutaryl-coenzyme A reductase 1-like n=1 Tax=Antedon mediterranea TaxID=105859 RepID=UPI003AF465D8
MSKLRILSRTATNVNSFGRYFSTSVLKQSSAGDDADFNARKSFHKVSNKATADIQVRNQSNQAESATATSVSLNNRNMYINQNALRNVDLSPLDDMYNDDTYTRSVEKYIGTVKVPVGMVNVDVNGIYAKGSFSVPMATTEAALVASYSRGCKLIRACGGVNTAVIGQTIQRVPEFIFRNLPDAYTFLQWFDRPEVFNALKLAAESTTNHGKLIKIVPNLHGNKVHVKFLYETGNASGQNISTFATNAAIMNVLPECPIQPEKWLLEAGGSQDKKASIGFYNNSRGLYVTGEMVCPKELVESILKTSVDNMNDANESTLMSLYMQGVTGLTYHASNALAAIFIACGQDPACVAESHVGVQEARKTPEGDLRLRITMPSLMVGTVGGGTFLPSQRTCLDIVQLPEEKSRLAFAEVILGVILGGELSIAGAMTAHHFSSAHHSLARKGNGVRK